MPKPASSPVLQLIRRVLDDPRTGNCSDQELLRRFLGEQDAGGFEALLRRHGPMVLDVCRGVLGNEADVEDAFQATFLILARKAKSIRKVASLACWLHGVAYRIARKAQAESAWRRKHEDRVPQQRAVVEAPDDLTWRELRKVVHDELSGLSQRHRAPLVLCYLEGKTQDEAAAQLGLAKGTLKGHLERGRALLRARLVRRGLGPAATLLAAAWPAVWNELPKLQGKGGDFGEVVFSPNGKTLAAAGKDLACWEVATGKELFRHADGWPRTVAFLSDGKLLATRDKDDVTRFWDTATGREVKRLAGQQRGMFAAPPTFSPDGKTMATGGEGSLCLWDLVSGYELHPSEGHYGTVTAIALSSDGKFLASGSNDWTLGYGTARRAKRWGSRCGMAGPFGP